MHASFAQAVPCDRAPRSGTRASARLPGASRGVLAVESVGYLVPASDGLGVVHSVFARACNIRRGERMLSLVAHELPDGPTTLRFARHAVSDLRAVLDGGEVVRFRGGLARCRRLDIDGREAAIWRPPERRRMAPLAALRRNVEHAGRALVRTRRQRSSVIDREGSVVVAALESAHCAHDAETAAKCIERLIGWGEGLTPAGDDFVTGWCAVGAALGDDDPRGEAFRHAIVRTIERCAVRTTPIAAHALRLAARGHFSAHIHGLCDALLRGASVTALDAALERMFAVGATSGADTAAGILSHAAAWLRTRVEA